MFGNIYFWNKDIVSLLKHIDISLFEYVFETNPEVEGGNYFHSKLLIYKTIVSLWCRYA